MNKHTRENFFQLVGFPEWWDETQKERPNWPSEWRAAVEITTHKLDQATVREPTLVGGMETPMLRTVTVADGERR